MNRQPGPPGGSPDLPRRIGFWGGSAIMLGIIIGSGIFRTPTQVAREMGSPAAILALWVLGGVLSLFGAFAYAELGTLFPRSGGIYVYLNRGLGGAAAFVFGWTYMLLIKPFAAGAIAVVFAEHFNRLFGLPWNPQAVGCALLIVLTGLNVIGIRLGAGVAVFLTGLKVLALAGIVALGAVLLQGSAANFAPSPAPRGFFAAFAPAIYGILFAYDGWSDVASVAGEVRDPRRLLPRILLAGTALTIGLYVAVNAVYLSMVPLAEMRTVDTVAPLVVGRLLGPAGDVVVTAMIAVSTLGATHGSIITGARVTFAQAQDGLLFRGLARIHPRFQTPHVSLWVQAALSCAAILYMRNFKNLSENFSFTMWIFYALAAAGVIALRRSRPDLERPYRCWGYPVVPALFILAALAMTVMGVLESPWQKLQWLGFLAAGVPAYFLWRRFAKPAV